MPEPFYIPTTNEKESLNLCIPAFVAASKMNDVTGAWCCLIVLRYSFLRLQYLHPMMFPAFPGAMICYLLLILCNIHERVPWGWVFQLSAVHTEPRSTTLRFSCPGMAAGLPSAPAFPSIGCIGFRLLLASLMRGSVKCLLALDFWWI